ALPIAPRGIRLEERGRVRPDEAVPALGGRRARRGVGGSVRGRVPRHLVHRGGPAHDREGGGRPPEPERLMGSPERRWAFRVAIDATLRDTDGLGHVNNAVYLSWI